MAIQKVSHQRSLKNDRLEVGDYVTIARRFFVNHNLPIYNLTGRLIHLSHTGNFALVATSDHPIFIKCHDSNFIRRIVEPNNIVIQIHPVYLEKMEVKRGKKK